MVGLGLLGGAAEVKIILKGVDDFSKVMDKAQQRLMAVQATAGMVAGGLAILSASFAVFSYKMATSLNAGDEAVQRFQGSIGILTEQFSQFAADVGTNVIKALQPALGIIDSNREAFENLGNVVNFVAVSLAQGISVVVGWIKSLGNAVGMVTVFVQEVLDGASATDAWARAQQIHQLVLEDDAASIEKFNAKSVQFVAAQKTNSEATKQDTASLRENNAETQRAIILRQQMSEVTAMMATSKRTGQSGGSFSGVYAQGAGGGIAFAPQGGTVGVDAQGRVVVTTPGGAGGSLSANRSTSTVSSSSGRRFNDASLMITPKGDVLKFSPDDTISLNASKKGGSTGGSINIYVQGSIVTEREIAGMVDRLLSRELRNKVTIGL